MVNRRLSSSLNKDLLVLSSLVDVSLDDVTYWLMILSVGLGSVYQGSLVVFFGMWVRVDREGMAKWNVSLSLRWSASIESIMGCMRVSGVILGSGSTKTKY